MPASRIAILLLLPIIVCLDLFRGVFAPAPGTAPAIGAGIPPPNMMNFNLARGGGEGNICGGNGWSAFENSCYKIVVGDMDWTLAVLQCQRESADAKLVSIGDEEENDFVRALASPALARVKAQNAARFDLYNSFWIGMRRARVAPGQYQSFWPDQSAVTFGNEPNQIVQNGVSKFPWPNGQPSGTNKWAAADGAAEECVSMFNQAGNWNDVGCDATLGGAICKKPANGGGGRGNLFGSAGGDGADNDED